MLFNNYNCSFLKIAFLFLHSGLQNNTFERDAINALLQCLHLCSSVLSSVIIKVSVSCIISNSELKFHDIVGLSNNSM